MTPQHCSRTWTLYKKNGHEIGKLNIIPRNAKLRESHTSKTKVITGTICQMLKCVDSYKDLGVIMSRDLSWSNHVDASVNIANKVLGLLKRAVGSRNKEIFSVLCRSLLRPLLEYASPVWSPYLIKDKLAIESIQRRASRIALGQNVVRCHMKRDANYRAGARLSVEENTSL